MEVRMPARAEGELEVINRDMRESQRALELRKFFAPNAFSNPSTERDFNESLNNDGALDAYAETVVWRLNGVHAMVSLIDRGTQYFLAGCIRPSGGDNRVMNIEEWFGCSMVPVPGGLCENTLALDLKKEQYPCFVVHDLSKDERFAQLPVVDGTMSSYRFYAGTPITTSHGVNIGSFFLFDDKSRPHGLLHHEKKFLHQQAANVMRHLETKREATERRRVALMSQGIARFLERDSHDANVSVAAPTTDSANSAHPMEHDSIQSADMHVAKVASGQSRSESVKTDNEPESSILDKIRVTLDQAAEILRESLELTTGGVLFLDTAVAFTDIDNTDAYTDKNAEIGATVQEIIRYEERIEAKGHHTLPQENERLAAQLSKRTARKSSGRYKTSKILAMSASGSDSWDPKSHILDTQTLHSLIDSYPKGNIWYIDEEGYFSSLEQINKLEPAPCISPSGRRQSIDITKQRAEANMLSRVFRKARQIIFLPLWDAAGNRWYSGCFVWSQTAVPVFTVESEVAYLSAFTNSLMAEISRLDAITSNKMKSDFISSISHEFRSPLHGILASAEFLRETEPNGNQLEFISTIQNCGGTLLDTINHVLDYSKINSFQKSESQQGTISNELYQMTNLALLCEDIVNGMIAANEYRGTGDASLPSSDGTTQLGQPGNADRHKRLEIILDIEHRDWVYNVQPGALRRVVMNIFGNAQKYTDSGYISVQLRMIIDPISNAETASLRIRDSGRGMSSEYMERKLYHPFAQEDTFAPGVGLGLSIVWSIVNQLGGKILIRSELGKGTEVEVTLPVQKAQANLSHSRHSDLLKVSQEAEECITTIRKRTAGRSVSIARKRSSASTQQDAIWNCIEKYCSEWFGFEIKTSGASILITDIDEDLDRSENEGILVVHDQMLCPIKHHGRSKVYAVESICQPIGPFRLARSLLALMDQDSSQWNIREVSRRSDHSTQTPLGSPEERAIWNGLIANDYGFEVPSETAHASSNADPSKSRTELIIQKEPGSDHTDQQYVDLDSASKMTLRLPPHRNLPSPAAHPTQLSSTMNLPLRTKATPPPTPTTSLRILAVDDNALNLQLIQRYLHKRKADTIVTARNGIEAVEAVRNGGNETGFDVIFMDISMPEMNGFEATRLIRAHERSQTPNTLPNVIQQGVTCRDEDHALPSNGNSRSGYAMEDENGHGRGGSTRQSAYIVALTGLASRRDRDEADESGFDDFLTKPISFGKIGELLARLSEEKARGGAGLNGA